MRRRTAKSTAANKPMSSYYSWGTKQSRFSCKSHKFPTTMFTAHMQLSLDSVLSLSILCVGLLVTGLFLFQRDGMKDACKLCLFTILIFKTFLGSILWVGLLATVLIGGLYLLHFFQREGIKGNCITGFHAGFLFGGGGMTCPHFNTNTCRGSLGACSPRKILRTLRLHFRSIMTQN